MKSKGIEVNTNIQALIEIKDALTEIITQATTVQLRLKLDTPNSNGFGMCSFVVEGFRDGKEDRKYVNGNFVTSKSGGIANYIEGLSICKERISNLIQIISNK